MKDEAKTKKELISELVKLRQEIDILKKIETGGPKAKESVSLEYRQLLSIFDSFDEPVYVADPDNYEVLYANQLLIRSFGDVVGKKCYRVFQNLDSPCSFCTNKYIFGDNLGKSYIWDFQNKSNQHWYHCTDKAIRWPDGRLVRCEVAIDITSGKRTRDALRASDEEFRLAFESAKDAIFWADPETGLITNCNKAAETLLEKDKSEIIGLPQTKLHPPRKMNDYVKKFREHIESKGVVDDEAEIITKSGEIKPVHITASLTLIGTKTIMQGIFRDITARKKAAKALHQSKRLLVRALYNLPDAVFICNPGMVKIIDCNPATSKIFDYSCEEILKTTLPALFTSEAQFGKFKELLLSSVDDRGFFHSADFKMKRKDGTAFPAKHDVVPIGDEKGNLTFWVCIVGSGAH